MLLAGMLVDKSNYGEHEAFDRFVDEADLSWPNRRRRIALQLRAQPNVFTREPGTARLRAHLLW